MGTILGPGVVVGAGATPPAYSRFSTAEAEEMSDDEDDEDEDGEEVLTVLVKTRDRDLPEYTA